MNNIDSNQTGGKAISPSTLVQLANSSLPPIDPRFFNTIDNIIDKNAPIASNGMIPSLLGQVGKTIEKFFIGGNEDPYKKKYLKYKQKYIDLKNKSNFV
jgi:hypothetical protein